MKTQCILLIAICLVHASYSDAREVGTESSNEHLFLVRVLANGLQYPWGMAFLPNGDVLVTERAGRLRRLTSKGLDPEPVAGIPDVVARGQGGLLDVAIDPRFAEQPLVYLCYSGKGKGGVGTEVARGKLEGDRLSGVEVIFRAVPKTGGSHHYGCRMVFNRQNYLFVSLGDRYSHMDNAQNTDDHMGTIVRIRADGTVPKDNPFVDGGAPEIFSFGHRNIQGLTIRPQDGSLWAHEHGPRGGDEVNRIESGVNYGWPAITYGVDYSGRAISDKTEMPGMAQPIVYWDPSIAPSGMAFYEGDAFPKWKGNLFVGSLKFTHLRRLVMEGDKVVSQEALLRDQHQRIRDVRVGSDGLIYLLTDSERGTVLRLEPIKGNASRAIK